MKIDARGRNLISLFEGRARKPYVCSAGHWTIGIGHRMTRTELQKWQNREMTEHQIDELFALDIERIELYIRKRVRVPLNQDQFNALCSFVFNIGRAQFGSSTLLRKLNNNKLIWDEWVRWVFITDPVTGKKKQLNGLITRRERERAVFFLDSLKSEEERLQVLRFYY